jgi:hypothetical protein
MGIWSSIATREKAGRNLTKSYKDHGMMPSAQAERFFSQTRGQASSSMEKLDAI